MVLEQVSDRLEGELDSRDVGRIFPDLPEV